MNPTIRHFAADTRLLPDILAMVRQAGVQAGLSDDLIGKSELVVEELFTNTATHGVSAANRGRQGEPVAVVAWLGVTIHEHVLELCYEDNGPAFDSTLVNEQQVTERVARAEIGGLGRSLINSLPASAIYSRQNGRNRLVLRFEQD